MDNLLNHVYKDDCVGKICESTNSGRFEIVSYKSNANVRVKFLQTGYETVCALAAVRSGYIKDFYLPRVCGVGITGKKYKQTYKDEFGKKKKTREYCLWTSMLQRCYYEKKLLDSPTYKDCTVSENFKHYEYFYEWCNKQIGFGNTGWDLDKDLLFKGNKVYSEDTCVFLPRELNGLLTNNKESRGDLPIGVQRNKYSNNFVSVIRFNSTLQTRLGYYKTPEEAFYAYKEAKEAFIKEQANKWKDKIDHRAFEALMNYKINIDD